MHPTVPMIAFRIAFENPAPWALIARPSDTIGHADSLSEGEQEAAKKLADAAKAVKKLGQRKVGNAFVISR